MVTHQQIYSRKTAREIKSSRYFTGVACKQGHFSQRNTNSGNCIECARVNMNAMRERDPTLAAEKYRAWADANKDELKKKWKSYRESRIDEYRAHSLRNYYENKEKYRELNKKWMQNNPDKRRASMTKRRCLVLGAEGSHTGEDIKEIIELQKHRCAGCRCDLKKSGYHVDHIIPLSGGGSNWRSNLQIMCPSCNTSKKDKAPEEWYKSKGFLL